jgi:PAS domain S-box-containing protein
MAGGMSKAFDENLMEGWVDNNNIHVLLIEDDKDISAMIQSFLEGNSEYEVSRTSSKRLDLKEYECTFDVEHKETLKEAVDCILREGEDSFDVVLVALGLPNGEGIEVFRKVSACCKTCPIIIISRFVEEALESVRLGAQDYIFKPELTRQTLIKSIRYSILRKKILIKKIIESDLESSINDIFSLILRADLNFSELSNMITNKIEEFTDSKDCFIGILNQKGNEIIGEGKNDFYKEVCVCHKDCFPDYSLKLDKDGKAHHFWAMAFNTCSDIIANDVVKFRKEYVKRSDCEVRARNMVMIPIVLDGRVVGQVSVANKLKGGYTDFDVKVIKKLANMFAVSLQKLRYENRLLEEKEQFRKVVETTQAIIYSISFKDDFKFTFVNEVMCEKTGYSRKELMKINIMNLLTPQSYQLFLERLSTMISGGVVPNTVEFEIKGKDERKGWVLVTSEIIRDDENNVVGANVIGIDISEKKKIEEELRLNRERLQMALEATTDGMWDFNVVTNYVYFSPRYERMLGYEPDELEKNYSTWLNLLHPDDRERCNLEVENMRKDIKSEYYHDGIYSNTFRMRCKDGSYKWISAKGKLFERDENNMPKRFVGTHLDITAEKELEASLIERETTVENRMNEILSEFSLYDDYHASRVKRLDEIINSLGNVSVTSQIGVKI